MLYPLSYGSYVLCSILSIESRHRHETNLWYRVSSRAFLGSDKRSFRFVVGPDSVTGKIHRRTVNISAKAKTSAQGQARKILAESDSSGSSDGTSAAVKQLPAEWIRFQSKKRDHRRDFAATKVSLTTTSIHPWAKEKSEHSRPMNLTPFTAGALDPAKVLGP